MSCSMIVVGFRLSSTTTTLMWSISSLHSTDFFVQPHSSDELYYYYTISELSSSLILPLIFIKRSWNWIHIVKLWMRGWIMIYFMSGSKHSSLFPSASACHQFVYANWLILLVIICLNFFQWIPFFFIQAESRSFHFSLSLPLLPLMNLICWTITSPSPLSW